jgi:hypothetical protein
MRGWRPMAASDRETFDRKLELDAALSSSETHWATD